MYIIINVIFLYIICIQSRLQDNINLRADCYRSFSDPVIFIKLLHYFPSGPLALTADFRYNRYSLKGGFTPETVIGQYHFSRYDFPCNTSTIFTTGGIFFNYMDVNIKIYLLNKKSKIADIYYFFYRGFKPGEYKLLDLDRDFAVELKILDTKVNYLETQKKLKQNFKWYIESISDTKGELCIITDNNRAAIVKLKKGLVLPGGYISGLSQHNYQETVSYKYSQSPAFLCQTHDKYYKERVIFIIEIKKISKRFEIIYLKSYINDEADFGNMEIEFEYPNFESFDKFENIPSIYNKIYTFPYYLRIIKNCSDGSKFMALYTEDNIKFSATVSKVVEITNGIQAYARFPTSLSDPCGEEERTILIV